MIVREYLCAFEKVFKIEGIFRMKKTEEGEKINR